MTIAYIRTYSNKQQTESQKNAIEQFAKAKKIEVHPTFRVIDCR